ncbi:MAG: NADH-quinone oxidoreductase subunit NuoG [Planctomycetaceae bacterium]|nr:NADH-quinone oxidoreductase subunit NuoG [Planctomycetaceae bacterium]
MPRIYIENKAFDFADLRKNLLHTCLSLGFDVPYFCWHPAFHSVGACRQCAVKVFRRDDDPGRIVMACMTAPADGMRVSISDAEAVAFRRKVIEWLMLNHPHDCPVCDEGGECHLQDMTVMTGHVYRRTRFAKRTFRNQDLGPLLTHEMNRCIQCYRCVRFYRNFAGGRDLTAMGWHDHVYFGRTSDGALQSVFAGNLVEVCPTGVFTDKTLARHYTRKWDLQTAPSICVHCAVGCNTIPGERYGTLRRILSRYHSDVNGYFLCDRGRFGYEFVNSPRRIRTPMVRRDGRLQEASPGEALARAAEILRGGKVLGVGSPRASLETNVALRRLVGANRFLHGMTHEHYRLAGLIQEILRDGPCPAASLREADSSDAVLVLGEDVYNTAPMLALALRQAVLEKPIAEARAHHNLPDWEDVAIREAIQIQRGPFFIVSPDWTELDDIATATCRAAPQDVARLGFAVAHRIDPDAPDVEHLPPEMIDLAARIAQALLEGQRPLVVSGIACGSDSVLYAAANVAWALRRKRPETRLSFTLPACNSMGLAMIPADNIEAALPAFREGRAESLLVVESNLYGHASKEVIDELLHRARHVIAIDCVTHATTQRAEVVLPAATFAEGDGTLVNNETRAQRFFQVFVPGGDVLESWKWLGRLAHAAGQFELAPWQRWQEVLEEMARDVPVLAGAADMPPSPSLRIDSLRVARQPHRYSGRTAMHAAAGVVEPQPPQDVDTPLAFSMEGVQTQPPPELIARAWAPGWNSAQAFNKFQIEVAGPLIGGDPGRVVITTAADNRRAYYGDIPPPFERRVGQWLVIPAYLAFGSDELSNLAPGVAQLAPPPHLAINPDDAGDLRVDEGGRVVLLVQGVAIKLQVRLRPSLPRGVAALPKGLPALPGLSLPDWGVIQAASGQGGLQ